MRFVTYLSLQFCIEALALGACATAPAARVATSSNANTEPVRSTPTLRVDDSARYLAWSDGRPFLYLADTCWELFHRTTLAEAELYLNDRAAKGFTVVQATLVSEMQGLTSPSSNGALPWKASDPASPNEEYFRYVDQVVDLAEKRGLVMALLPAWGDRFDSPSNRAEEVFTTKNAEIYGKFLGQRYQNKNVIWILGGGRNPKDDEDLSIIRSLAKGLKNGHQGRHLMTYHPFRRGASYEWFHDDSWLSFNMFQSGHESPNMPEHYFVWAGYERNPAKPVLDGESNYEDHPYNWESERPRFTDVFVRKQAYWSLLSGAAGHAYGHNSVWQLWQPDRQAWSVARTQWKEALNAPGAQQMALVRKLMESRPFERLRPDASLLNDKNEHIYNYVSLSRAEDGSFAMLYTPTGRPLDVNLQRLSPGRVRASWFDPRTGGAFVEGSYESVGTHMFVPPVKQMGDGNDFVLVLDRESENFPAPGSANYVRNPKPPITNGQTTLLDGVFRYETDAFLGDIHPVAPLASWQGKHNYKGPLTRICG